MVLFQLAKPFFMVENVHLQTRIDYINCIRPCLHELQAFVILHSNFQMSVIF